MISASRLRNAPVLLFQEGEAGLFLDPSVVEKQYQTSHGGTPVTGFGQPVGLAMELRTPIVEGVDLFNDASVGFSGEASRVTPGVYRVYSSAGAYSGAIVANGLVANKWFIVRFTIDSITTLGAGVSIESKQNTVFTTVGTHTAVVCTATTNIQIKRAATACDIQISNISVKAIPGNHSYQITPQYRPTVEARVNLFDKTSELTHSSWTFAGGVKVGGQPGVKGLPTATKFNGPSTGTSSRALTVYTSSITFSVKAKWVSGSVYRSFLVRNNTTATNFDSCVVNLATGAGGGTGWTVTPVENGYFKLTYSRSTGISPGNAINFYYGTTGAATEAGEWLIDEPQVEIGPTATTYQAVDTSTNYTDIGGPRYWQLDGVDDKFLIDTIAGAFYGVNRAVIFGMQHEGAVTGATRVLFGRGAADWYVAMSSTGILMGSHSSATNAQKTATHGAALTVSAKSVYSLGWSTSGANVTMSGRKDGVAQAPSVAMPMTDGYIGSSGGPAWALGDLAQGAPSANRVNRQRLYAFIYRNAATTEAQYQQNERWLKSRMQIAG